MTNLIPWLTLHHALHGTPRSLRLLLEAFKSPETILSLFKDAPEKLKLTTMQTERLKKANPKQIELTVNWAEKPTQHIITFHDPDYPNLLKETYDPPMLLYVLGNKSILSTPQIAIVGSRKPSHSGSENAKHFATAFAKAGMTVTSGMAIGIDGSAHQGALDAEAGTIAVLGCGANIVYPKRHKSLAEHIIEKGAIVSEYPLYTEPFAENFPRRNRIISGMSRATLVVEATLKSGSLITARFANEQGRDVFAIPGSIHNPQASGCHHLIKEGAGIATCVQDVLSELNITSPLEISQDSAIYIEELDGFDNKLLEIVGFETRSVQYLINEIKAPTQNIASRLLKLELRGYIKAVPGGYCRAKL